MTLLVVDDHTLFRQSLVRVLRGRWPQWTFLEAGTGQEALESAAQAPVWLVLLDLNLGRQSGLTVLESLRVQVPEVRTLVVSMHRDGQHVAAALRARVQGFIGKDAPLEKLLEAVEALTSDRTWFEPELLDQAGAYLHVAEDWGGYRTLTGREQEVFLLLAEGNTVAEISRRLGRSSKTVENHRTAVYQKLGLGDRYELFTLARRLGMIL